MGTATFGKLAGLGESGECYDVIVFEYKVKRQTSVSIRYALGRVRGRRIGLKRQWVCTTCHYSPCYSRSLRPESVFQCKDCEEYQFKHKVHMKSTKLRQALSLLWRTMAENNGDLKLFPP